MTEVQIRTLLMPMHVPQMNLMTSDNDESTSGAQGVGVRESETDDTVVHKDGADDRERGMKNKKKKEKKTHKPYCILSDHYQEKHLPIHSNPLFHKR